MHGVSPHRFVALPNIAVRWCMSADVRGSGIRMLSDSTGCSDENSLGHSHTRDTVQGNLRAKPVCQQSQSARSVECRLSKLPYGDGLEADSVQTGIRSQSDQIPSARDARVSNLQPMPYQTRLFQYRNPVCRLPCRHSQAPVGSELRTMPQRQGMERTNHAD